MIEFNADVKKGHMERVKIFGDFFGRYDVSEIEEALVGAKHNEEDIRKILSSFEISNYFFNITIEQLLKVMCYNYKSENIKNPIYF